MRKNIIKNNPQYLFLLWTDKKATKLMKNKYSKYYKTFTELKRNIKCVDFFKYILMLEYGGIYIDMDMVFVKPFDHSIFEGARVFLSKDEYYPISLHNCFLASEPKEKFWKLLLNKIKYYTPGLDSIINENLDVLYHTGPIMVMSAYKSYKNPKSIKIFEKTLFIDKSSESYVYHTYDSSWWNINSILKSVTVGIILCIIIFYILSKK